MSILQQVVLVDALFDSTSFVTSEWLKEMHHSLKENGNVQSASEPTLEEGSVVRFELSIPLHASTIVQAENIALHAVRNTLMLGSERLPRRNVARLLALAI